MKKISLIALLMVITQLAFSQITYTSVNNKKQDWTAATAWTRTPAASSPALPGNPTNSSASAIRIYGYTRSEVSLTVNNANPVITVYDTLFVFGDLTLGSGASMTIPTGGLLVVTGTLKLQGSFNLTNNGNVVVKGSLNVTNGNFINNSNLYVFTSTSASGGGKVNGCDGFGNPGGCNPTTAGNVKNSSNLASNNSSLYNFVSNNGILPIKLIYFRISEITSEKVVLDWATSNESEFDKFVIERSNDVMGFREIGSLKGAGYNTEDVQKYQFEDFNPFIGNNYYRLKAVDLDGTFEYFEIKLASVTSPMQFSVYPNPSMDGVIRFKINFEPTEESQIAIFNSSGFKLKNLEVTVVDGELNFSEPLERGVYMIQYLSKQFNETVRVIVR